MDELSVAVIDHLIPRGDAVAQGLEVADFPPPILGQQSQAQCDSGLSRRCSR